MAYPIVVTCADRMADYLEKEVIDMGFEINKKWNTGVQIIGTLDDCIALNLLQTTGNQVLLELFEARAKDPNELYNVIKDFAWEQWIDVDGYFSVTVWVENDFIDNTMFPAMKCKDAIADRFREKFDKRPNSGSDRDRTVIHLRWRDKTCTLFLDTTGETGSRHGYRKIPYDAPLKENLACGVLAATKWEADVHFINPMCGSGTLAIEAALKALAIPPNTFRENFGFMHTKDYDHEVFLGIKREILKNRLDALPNGIRIIATDNAPQAITAAMANARNAGVEHLIDFEVCDFEDTEIPEGPGVVVVNPQYAMRLGEAEEMEKDYKRLGDFFKQKCKGKTGFIFTGNPALAKKIGLSAAQKIPFYNAKIDCRLFKYELYDGSRRKTEEDKLNIE